MENKELIIALKELGEKIKQFQESSEKTLTLLKDMLAEDVDYKDEDAGEPRYTKDTNEPLKEQEGD